MKNFNNIVDFTGDEVIGLNLDLDILDGYVQKITNDVKFSFTGNKELFIHTYDIPNTYENSFIRLYDGGIGLGSNINNYLWLSDGWFEIQNGDKRLDWSPTQFYLNNGGGSTLSLNNDVLVVTLDSEQALRLSNSHTQIRTDFFQIVGTGDIGLPAGTTAQRSITGYYNYTLRANYDTQALEYSNTNGQYFTIANKEYLDNSFVKKVTDNIRFTFGSPSSLVINNSGVENNTSMSWLRFNAGETSLGYGTVKIYLSEYDLQIDSDRTLISGTGCLALPSGTAAQRQTLTNQFSFRGNRDTDKLEVHAPNSGGWKTILTEQDADFLRAVTDDVVFSINGDSLLISNDGGGYSESYFDMYNGGIGLGHKSSYLYLEETDFQLKNNHGELSFLSAGVTLSSSKIVNINNPEGIKIPSGTTAQRPITQNGLIRYNVDTNKIEGVENNQWVNVSEVVGGGSGSTYPYYAEMAGVASSQIGVLAKASNVNNVDNPSGKALTSPTNSGATSNVTMGYLMFESRTLTKIGIKFAKAAVGTGTVGASPTVKIRVFRQNFTDRTQLGADINIPISPTGVGIFNSVNADSFQFVSHTISIAVNAGDIIGWEFVNQPDTNNGINAISTLHTFIQ
jgi:hypothetical protein